MSGAPISRIYCEIDLDFTPYTASQKRLLKDATSTTLNIEKSYKDLGIRSAAEFDLMRAKISNAYTRITNDAKTSAQDIIRAERAKADQLKRIDAEQFGARTSMLSSFKSNWLATSAAIYASYRVLSKGFAMAEASASYIEQAQLLDTLAQKYGTSAKSIISSVREASDGLVTMATAAESAASSMAKGLSPDQIIGLAEAAGTLSDVMGKTADESFKSLNEAMETGKAKSIKLAVGVIDLEERYGHLYSQMSEVDKQQALYNIVMEKTAEINAQMEGSVKSLSDKIEKLHTQWADLKLMMGSGFLQIGAEITARFQEIAASAIMVGAGFYKLMQGYELTRAFFTMGEEEKEHRKNAEQYAEDYENMKEKAAEWALAAVDNHILAQSSLDDLTASTANATAKLEEHKKVVGETKEQYESGIDSLNNFRMELDQISRVDLSGNLGIGNLTPEGDFGISAALEAYSGPGSEFSTSMRDTFYQTWRVDYVEAVSEGTQIATRNAVAATKERLKAESDLAKDINDVIKKAQEKVLRDREDRERKFLDNIQDITGDFYRDIASGQLRTFEDVWDKIKDYAISALVEIAAKQTAMKIGEWTGSSGGGSTNWGDKIASALPVVGAGFAVGQWLGTSLGLGGKDYRMGPLSSYSWQANATKPWDQMGEWHDQQGGWADQKGYGAEWIMDGAFNAGIAAILDPTKGLPSWMQDLFKSAVDKANVTVDLTGKTFNFNSDADFEASANVISNAITNQVKSSLAGVYTEVVPTITNYLSGLDLSMLSPNSYLFNSWPATAFQSAGEGRFDMADGISNETYLTHASTFLSVLGDIQTKWTETLSTMNTGLDQFISDPLTTYESTLKRISDITKVAYETAGSLGISESALADIRDREAAAIAATTEKFAGERADIFGGIDRYLSDITGTATDLEKALWPVNDKFEGLLETLKDKGMVEGSDEYIRFMDAWDTSIKATTDSIIEQTAAEAAATLATEKATEANEALARRLEYYTRAAGVRTSFVGFNDQLAYKQFSIGGGQESDWYMGKIRDIQGQTVVTMDDLEKVADLTGSWITAAISEATNAAQASNQAAQSWTEVVDHTSEVMKSIDATVRGLTYGNLNVSLPGQKYASASSDYTGLFQKAMGGDTSAVDEFLSFTSTYLQSAQDKYKSSGQYQSIYASTLADIDMIKSRAESGGFIEHIARTTEAVSSMASEVHVDLSGIGDVLSMIEGWSEDQLDSLELNEISLGDIDLTLEGIDKTLVEQLAEAKEQNNLLKQLLAKPMSTTVNLDGGKWGDAMAHIADSIDVQRDNRGDSVTGVPLYS